VLCEQVRFARLCTDSGQVYDPARPCFFERGFQRGGDLLRLRQTQRRIEVRRNKHKDALRPFECRRKRRGVSDVRYRHFATALCPGITFAAVAHHGSNGPPGSQKVIRYVAANIASDSSYGKHSFLVRSTRKPVVHLFCGLRVIWPGTVTEEGNSLGQNLVRVGFVDELAAAEDVVARAHAWLRTLLALPARAMSGTRAIARTELVAAFDAARAQNADEFVRGWFSDESRATLTAVMAKLKKS